MSNELDSYSEMSDNDSSSSLEIVVHPKKLREELARELEEEQKAAAENGEPTYSDGTAVKIGADGKPRSERIVRLEKIIKKRKEMRARVMQNITKHMQGSLVRKAYNYFTRDIPETHDLFQIKKKIIVTADEDRLCVMVVRRPILHGRF